LLERAEYLAKNGHRDDAIAICWRAVKEFPNHSLSRLLLAQMLHESRKFNQAAEQFQRATRLDPHNARAWSAYGTLFANMHEPTKAGHCFRAALAIGPSVAEFNNNLAMSLARQGRLDSAVHYYRRALDLKPDASAIHSNLLLAYNMQQRPDENLLPEHQDWAARHAARFYPQPSSLPATSKGPSGRLRIGYISADFRRHPVAYFLQPLLREHDRSAFEIFCYSDVRRPDDMTALLRARADQWRNIKGLSDEQTAQQIRADHLDVLVDLSGHMGNHRLLVFARRVAPVQVTYMAYPNTTGLATMDYRITDSASDPPGLTDAQYSESLVRLPSGFLCYQPPANSPPPRPRLRQHDGAVTFGCFNNLGKVTPWMLAIWARLLHGVPDSRLIVKSDGLCGEEARDDLAGALVEMGIDESRFDLLGRIPSFVDHLVAYHRLDIALDTFPYHGTTTTCEALWMGVPVITLAGNSHRSRVGVSLLKSVMLEDLIASTPDEYISLAVQLAGDYGRRWHISSQLRDRMLDSPLTRGRVSVRELEAAYISMRQGQSYGH